MHNLYKPTHLRELCKEYNLTPSKKYGQNYLISEMPIRKMMEAGELNKKDEVVEIGPGFGVLTLAMAPLVKNVVAFEIERKLKGYWDKKVVEFMNIDVVWGNALKKLEIESKGLKGGYKVLANLPYQITSNILRAILELDYKPERVVVMVQKEVAQRICAGAGEMSLLAVSVQYFGIPKIVTKVSRNSFWPAPKVDSAVLLISDIKDRSREESIKFFKVVKAGFTNKRKQLWRNLAQGLELPAEEVKLTLLEVTGNEKVRAQELTVGDWGELVSKLELKV